MGKQTNRIEKRVTTIELDEAAIRAAYLAGDAPSTIASRAPDKAHYAAIIGFIAMHRDVWLRERLKLRRMPNDKKIVVERCIYEDEMGRSRFMKISLPRVSMHIAAMQEAQQ